MIRSDMQHLTIGSVAALKYIDNFRKPKDYDFFSPSQDCDLTEVSGLKLEQFWHPAFADWIPPGTKRYANLDELYTLKVSHSYWDLHGTWNKHISDAMTFKHAGAQLDLGLHKMLYKVWEEKHGAKRLKLAEEAEEFFEDAVDRLYVHDSLHASVAYYDKPIYESILKDGATVDIDMSRLKALEWSEQVKLFREEIYVTALERWLVPHDYKFSPRHAYALALKKTIVSLTKGWSSRFIVENYDVFRAPDIDYIQRHLNNKDKLIKLEN